MSTFPLVSSSSHCQYTQALHKYNTESAHTHYDLVNYFTYLPWPFLKLFYLEVCQGCRDVLVGWTEVFLLEWRTSHPVHGGEGTWLWWLLSIRSYTLTSSSSVELGRKKVTLYSLVIKNLLWVLVWVCSHIWIPMTSILHSIHNDVPVVRRKLAIPCTHTSFHSSW